MAKDYEAKLAAVVDSLVSPGEELLGTCMATKQSAFKGSMVAIAVTDRRLVIQEMNRRFETTAEPVSITPETLESAKLSRGSGGGFGDSPSSAIMNKATVTVKLRTTDGTKLKLVMMHGKGIFGKLGGGEDQSQAVDRVLGRLGLIDPTHI